jgi:murein DD-endopeptidase MepM/ murein hydrolase activator NlpD
VGRAAALALLALAAAAGCHLSGGKAPLHPQSPPGRWYVIAPGETLEMIAQRADVPVADLLEINGLTDPAEARPGRTIYVLAAPAPAASPPADPGAPPPLATTRTALRWPLATARIVIASPFGTREGRPHEGIDLPAPIGTPVYAAADGRVAYAGNGIRGYGNMVVVKHAGDLLTVDAHNSVLLVVQGQPVRAGDRIARVGQSGRASGPHLHFEVRAGQIPRNPMGFLPELTKQPQPLQPANLSQRSQPGRHEQLGQVGQVGQVGKDPS